MTKDVLDFSQGVTRWAPIHRQALLYYIEAHLVTKDTGLFKHNCAANH